MLWTLLALASWVALGGFIAYYGDLQGRRWGKKRVSWLGLRPKHTAILITSLTGALIALLSIVTLLAINKPLRDIVLRGEEAIRENRRLNAQLVEERVASVNSLREARNREQLVRADYENACRETADKQRQLEALNGKLADLDTQRRKLLLEYTDLQRDYFREKHQALQLQQVEIPRLQRNKRELWAWNKNAGEINRELGSENVSLGRQNMELTKNNQDLKDTNGKLTEGNRNLTGQRDELFKANSALMEANKQLVAGNEEEQQRANELTARLGQLNKDLAQLNHEFDFLSDERTSIAHSYLALRQGKFSLRAGAELARRTLDPHLTPDAVRRRLNELLDEASAEAISHGAVRGDNNRAVRIVSKRALTLTGAQDADESASLNFLADQLAASDTQVVVVVNAINNSVEGEQVLVELTPFVVQRIFAKDDMVAQCVVDAHQPSDRIFDAIVQFLNKEVRAAALKAGTIPQTDPETGERRIGSMLTSDLIKLAERIRRMGGQVILTAVAADQTTSADPLRLSFKLSHPPDTGRLGREALR